MAIEAEFLKTGQIGSLTLNNRLIRAATSETMATKKGGVTEELVGLYAELAKGGAGLLISGHAYVIPGGQCSPRQIGIYSDDLVPGLQELTAAIHRNGGRIFCELSHAGSQSVMRHVEPLAPSIVENSIFSRRPREMSEADIEAVVTAFGEAARRAAQAGFDGIHLHAGNGYLISQFCSPLTNRRVDGWGGDPERRSKFVLAVYDAVRSAVGSRMPISARFGVADSINGGLDLSEGIARLKTLVARGLDAVEPTYANMHSYQENIRPYVAVTLRRAIQDWLVPRLWHSQSAEAYYLPFAKAVKEAVDITVILVGGIRSTEVMSEILASGAADFFSLARPFVREPDLANALKAGRRGRVDCVSCNICLMHDGYDSLKCWRKGALDLSRHVGWRLRH